MPQTAGAGPRPLVLSTSRWSFAVSRRFPFVPTIGCAAVILENGVVRTLDPRCPPHGALAIAGDRVAGGVGMHETALASPGGRRPRRALRPARLHRRHVHFPTWSLAQDDVRLEGASSLAEALDRVSEATRRGTGSAAPAGAMPSGRRADRGGARRGHRRDPAALWSKDYHSLWLNSAALALAGGDLEVEGGVVERDDDGEPTGVLREESAWRFRERHVR